MKKLIIIMVLFWSSFCFADQQDVYHGINNDKVGTQISIINLDEDYTGVVLNWVTPNKEGVYHSVVVLNPLSIQVIDLSNYQETDCLFSLFYFGENIKTKIIHYSK